MVRRLKDVRKALGFNQTDFAKQLGITQTAYSMIESGSRPLADRYVKVICSAFHVNQAWLNTGEGEMFLAAPQVNELLEVFNHLLPETRQYLLLMAREILNLQQNWILTLGKSDLEEQE